MFSSLFLFHSKSITTLVTFLNFPHLHKKNHLLQLENVVFIMIAWRTSRQSNLIQLNIENRMVNCQTRVQRMVIVEKTPIHRIFVTFIIFFLFFIFFSLFGSTFKCLFPRFIDLANTIVNNKNTNNYNIKKEEERKEKKERNRVKELWRGRENKIHSLVCRGQQ